MNLLEVTQPTAAPEFAKYLRAAEKKVRNDLASYFRHKPAPKLEVTIVKPYEAKMTIEFQNYLDPKSIDYADDDFKDALKRADVNGHIHKLEVGNATGSEFVEALLSGLKPGMNVKSEAFFPTLEYVITFKQIVSRRG